MEAASSLGIDLVVAAEEAPPLDLGDRFVLIDCSDPHASAVAIVDFADRVPIDGIVAADDAGVLVAALAGRELGVIANPPDAAAATRNKVVMRRRLAAAEVPQPSFGVITGSDDVDEAVAHIGFPLVIKPLSRSASQGVTRVDRPEQLSGAVDGLRDLLARTGGNPNEAVLAEAYMSGAEVAVEGIIRDGVLDILAVFDKPDTPPGPTFPETLLITPSRLHPEVIDEVERVAVGAVTALGLETGPVHVELKVDGPQVRVIEVAGRSIGGLCSRSLRFGLMGTTLEALILRNALGMEKPELRRQRSASGVYMIPTTKGGTFRGASGIDEVLAAEGIDGVEITVHPGDRVEPLPGGDRYLGFVFASGPDPQGVEQTLRRAAATLHLEIA